MRSDGGAFLDVAAALADRIARSAAWHRGRCNWVGVPSADGAGAVAALGPDLYEGTSGVGLFLAEAAAVLDDDGLRATAAGAIRLAIEQAGTVEPDVRDGLYAGPVGVAYAAARSGRLLSAEELSTGARELLARWWTDDRRSASTDVMSGCAGAVLGLVALVPLLEEPWLLDAATRVGDELIERAETGPEGWSWASPGRPSMHNLCGYAHGAAGIGHALAELFGATGDARFRRAAERAFDYERSWLDRDAGTWADLRGVARRAGRDAPVPAADSWCNGAPGIALSRLRAAELLGSPALARDAELALAAGERHVAELLLRAADDFCLCHGAAGAADVLVSGGDGRDELAARMGRRGVELHTGPGRDGFPCGVPAGDTPGLLPGFAGIGMFYLRLSEPRVPSPLLVRPPVG